MGFAGADREELADWISQQAVSVGTEQKSRDFISHKSIVEIAKFDGAIRNSILHVNSRQAVAAGFQVGVEVHPVAAQGGQTIAMPKEPGKAIELMRRIQPVKQSIFNVVRSPLS